MLGTKRWRRRELLDSPLKKLLIRTVGHTAMEAMQDIAPLATPFAGAIEKATRDATVVAVTDSLLECGTGPVLSMD